MNVQNMKKELLVTTRRAPAILATCGLVASLALLASGCGSRTPSPTAQRTSAAAPTVAVDKAKLRKGGDIPFERSWDLTLPSAVHLSWVSPDIPELLFVQVEGSNAIYAIDAFSGATRWVTQPLPRPLAVAPAVVRLKMPSGRVNETVNDDRLYVVSDDTLWCFDAVYGEKIWNLALPFSPSSGPLAVGPDGNLRVFLGDWAGRMQTVTWVPDKGMSYRLWQLPTGAPFTAPAVENEALVYAGDHGGTMHCFKLERDEAWKFAAGGQIHGSADPVARVLYFGTTANVLYALNRLSGEEMAKLYLNAPIERAPFHFLDNPGRVYVWTTDKDPSLGGLWAIDAKQDLLEITHNLDAQNKARKREILRMSKAFFVPGATRLVSSTPEHLYVTCGESTTVLAVNRATGNTDWAWDLNDGRKDQVVQVTTYQDPTDQNRSIFAIDEKNRIVAYRLFGYKPTDQAIAAMRPAAEPVAPKGKKKDADGAAPAAAVPADAPAAAH
jgi:outer membrane protein assembly factor BamB